jgi:multiple sugar transport system substrate-binding protein
MPKRVPSSKHRKVPMHAISPSLSRREFLSLAGLAAAGTALSACNVARPRLPSSGGDRVQLVYQDWPVHLPLARRMLEQFHASHPNIRVFYTPDPEGNFVEQMRSDMQAGTAPDVFQGCCTHFPTWAQMGYTLDLRPYVEADLDQAIIDDWDPAQYKALFTRDGRQFGLPKYHGSLALYYNKDLFDLYGVDYPNDSWDHDDYLNAMKSLTHKRSNLPVASNPPDAPRLWGSMIDVTWDRVQVHVNGWGGHLVDPNDPTQCRMAEPEAMAAMEWIRARMWDDKVMATNLDMQNMTTRQAFILGRLAMVEDGSWALKDILSNSDFRIGVAPFPEGPVRRVTLATTDAFGIYAGTKHPDAAWELVKFLISQEYGRALAQTDFLQPARASLVDDWIGFVRQEFPQKADDVDIAAFADGHIKGYSVTAEIFANMADARRLTDAAWDQIFTLGQAPIEQMRDLCRQIEATQN